MTHVWKVGDTGLTRSGRPFRVICTDVDSESYAHAYVLMCTKNGVRMAELLERAAKLMPHVYDEDCSLVWMAAREWVADFEKFQKGEQ